MTFSRSLKSVAVTVTGIGVLVGAGTIAGAASSSVAHADPFQITANGGINVRSGPGLDSPVVGTFGGGQRVESTGPAENGWLPVRFMGETAYVSVDYVTSVPRPGGAEPAPEQPAPQEPGNPAGTAWVTTTLNVRSGPGIDNEVVGQLNRGDQVNTTGEVRDGWTQIEHGGGTAWVASRYLSDTEPEPEAPAPAPPVQGPTDPGERPPGITVTGEEGLRPATRKILNDSIHRFPQIRVYGGVRPDPLPDHPSGRALDIMIPSYRSNNALGWEIANYYRAHAAEFDIQYIIFDQQIWSVARNGEGWRWMSDRGGDTANHRDHVHITVN